MTGKTKAVVGIVGVVVIAGAAMLAFRGTRRGGVENRTVAANCRSASLAPCQWSLGKPRSAARTRT